MGKQIARTTTPLGFRGPLDDLFLMGYHSYFVRVWKDTILKLFYYFSFLRLYPFRAKIILDCLILAMKATAFDQSSQKKMKIG